MIAYYRIPSSTVKKSAYDIVIKIAFGMTGRGHFSWRALVLNLYRLA
jgi:hypothetical protein